MRREGDSGVPAGQHVEAEGDRLALPHVGVVELEAQVQVALVLDGTHLAQPRARLVDHLRPVPGPLASITVHRDHRFAPGVRSDEAEVLLVGERVEPELAARSRALEVDGVPGELEPLVGPFEDEAAGAAFVLDQPQHLRVHGHRLLLGMVALRPAERPRVSRADGRRDAELGDHHRHAAMVPAQRRDVAGVGIGPARVPVV